ncbi:hypothetical protein ACQBAU_01675 [Propionibacteriaceae bacterium Y2011]
MIANWWRSEEDPKAIQWREVGEGRWRLHDAEELEVSGRLIGGCIETIVNLAGTPYGDVAAFGERYASDGLIVYLEASEDEAATICRNLHGLRLAGWFEQATAILIGRTNAGDNPKMTQEQAVLDALGRLDLPIVFDVEIGHVPPHLPLVSGAMAAVTVDAGVHNHSRAEVAATSGFRALSLPARVPFIDFARSRVSSPKRLAPSRSSARGASWRSEGPRHHGAR